MLSQRNSYNKFIDNAGTCKDFNAVKIRKKEGAQKCRAPSEMGLVSGVHPSI